jgi:uncharacterized repeat protein (TIGR01451 family)
MSYTLRSRAPDRAHAWLRGALLLLALAVPGALLAAPLAGTQIGNQASATYTDANGVPQTATSNLVITTVLPVYGVDVEQALTQTAVPASTASFPFSVENLGNDADSFTLVVTDPPGGDFTCASVAIYADADGNGAPDNFTDLSGSAVGPVAPGAVATFVATCQVPGTATAGNQNSILVTSTSVADPSQSDSVTDTILVTNNAVVTLLKSLSATSGAPGSGPYTVTLTYTNNGNATATDVRLSDVLDPGLTYVASSARWSVTGATVLTDANATDAQGTAPNQIVYDFGVTAADTVTAVINQVLPGQSGTLTFSVTVAASAAPGVIPNTATVSYDDDDNGGTPPIGGTSNTTFFNVTPTAGVSIVGPPPIASAAPGSTVVFTNVLTNDGDSTDRFDIRLQNSTFPPGTGFFLYRDDGVTPLVNGGGNPTLPDTPFVAPGASYDVVLRVVLPPGAIGGGPFSVEKVAISVLNPSVESVPAATDTLTTISANTVDVTNPSGGAGQGPEATPVETQSVNPGATASFSLTITNTSAVADNYNLAASIDATDTGAPGLDTLTLPPGWNVVFRNGGSTITNTGPIAAGASLTISADVTVPLGAAAVPAPGQSLFFQALSPVTSALDVKHDAVIVNTVRNVVISPDNTGQAFPGGSVVYAHTLTNSGSVTEPAGSITLSTLESNGLWGSQIFRDVNGDGVLDGGDTPIVGPGDVPALAPGASLAILVRVNAPPGAAVGSINTTTVTATPSAVVDGTGPSAPDSAVDTTSVVSGNLTLQKEQALDATCDGVADGAYGPGALSALPGTCILYRITATNAGTTDITALVISDSTPTETTQSTLTSVTPGGAGLVTEPGIGGTGTIQVDVGAVGPLPPGSTVVVGFGVQIEP